MPLYRYDFDVLLNAPTYQALGGVNAYVCSQPSNANQLNPNATPIPPAPLATLYADAFGTTLVNPVVTDSNGHGYFYVNPGTYDVVVNDPLGRLSSTFVYLDQNIGVASGGGGLAFQTNGVANANQSLLNIANGTGISAVNSGGTVTLTNTGFTPVAVNAHYVYVGPLSGSGLPSFRLLTIADLPTGAGTIGGSIAANQVAVGSGANAIAGSSALTFASSLLALTGTQSITSTSATGLSIVNPNTATSPSTQYNAPSLVFTGSVWDGMASAAVNSTFSFDMTGIGNATPSLASTTLTLNHNNIDVPAYFTMGANIYRFTSEGENVFGTATSGTFNIETEQSNGTVFTLTSVANAVGSLTTYAGTFVTIFPTSGQYVTIAGFTNGANNGRFLVSGTATSTHVTVYNSSGVAETHPATATIDNASAFFGNLSTEGYGQNSGFHLNSTLYNVTGGVQAEPSAIPFVIQMAGNTTDAGYTRIVNDPTTGNHGLEVGAVVTGTATGTSPVYMQLGHFGGQSCVQFSHPIVAGNENITVDTGLTGGVLVTPIATNSDANFALLPTGTSTTSNIEWRNASDPSNVGVANIKLIGTTWYFEALAIGTGSLPVNMDTTAMFLQIQQHTPSSSSDTGVAGTICYDASYIYQCIATNTWKRTAITTW